MKLDDKIQTRRVAYLLKGEQSTAFELALLYYILATRRSAEDKIADACLKSIQWLKKVEIGISDDISLLKPSDQLKSLERALVNNKAMICRQADLPDRQALVHAIPINNWDFGLAY
ncbi:MAG: hypothetical protein WC903_08610 [Candidatus Margulisiibacteriota bacterium]